MKLLMRLYDPERGQVMVDGKSIRNLQLKAFRAAVGYVSQEVHLFDGSVRDNISYGRSEANMEEIVRAAKAAEAHDFIMELPCGYDSLVGENGCLLSGGQRQRISIARAILKDPAIYIFDEATSAVDNETEAAIQRALARMTQDRTTIIVAHRLATVRHADRIFVLHEGNIAEHGTHETLLEQRGLYYGLWQVQTGQPVEAK
jgi:ATP-binding cassette subfamily B protein